MSLQSTSVIISHYHQHVEIHCAIIHCYSYKALKKVHVDFMSTEKMRCGVHG